MSSSTSVIDSASHSPSVPVTASPALDIDSDSVISLGSQGSDTESVKSEDGHDGERGLIEKNLFKERGHDIETGVDSKPEAEMSDVIVFSDDDGEREDNDDAAETQLIAKSQSSDNELDLEKKASGEKQLQKCHIIIGASVVAVIVAITVGLISAICCCDCCGCGGGHASPMAAQKESGGIKNASSTTLKEELDDASKDVGSVSQSQTETGSDDNDNINKTEQKKHQHEVVKKLEQEVSDLELEINQKKSAVEKCDQSIRQTDKIDIDQLSKKYQQAVEQGKDPNLAIENVINAMELSEENTKVLKDELKKSKSINAAVEALKASVQQEKQRLQQEITGLETEAQEKTSRIATIQKDIGEMTQTSNEQTDPDNSKPQKQNPEGSKTQDGFPSPSKEEDDIKKEDQKQDGQQMQKPGKKTEDTTHEHEQQASSVNKNNKHKECNQSQSQSGGKNKEGDTNPDSDKEQQAETPERKQDEKEQENGEKEKNDQGNEKNKVVEDCDAHKPSSNAIIEAFTGIIKNKSEISKKQQFKMEKDSLSQAIIEQIQFVRKELDYVTNPGQTTLEKFNLISIRKKLERQLEIVKKTSEDEQANKDLVEKLKNNIMLNNGQHLKEPLYKKTLENTIESITTKYKKLQEKKRENENKEEGKQVVGQFENFYTRLAQGQGNKTKNKIQEAMEKKIEECSNKILKLKEQKKQAEQTGKSNAGLKIQLSINAVSTFRQAIKKDIEVFVNACDVESKKDTADKNDIVKLSPAQIVDKLFQKQIASVRNQYGLMKKGAFLSKALGALMGGGQKMGKEETNEQKQQNETQSQSQKSDNGASEKQCSIEQTLAKAVVQIDQIKNLMNTETDITPEKKNQVQKSMQKFTNDVIRKLNHKKSEGNESQSDKSKISSLIVKLQALRKLVANSEKETSKDQLNKELESVKGSIKNLKVTSSQGVFGNAINKIVNKVEKV